MRKKKSLGSMVGAALIALLVWFLKEKGLMDEGSGGKGSWGSAKVPGGEISDGQFSQVAQSGGGYTFLKKCRFITGRNSDGDSFHVKHEDGETEFRLYYVDTPESVYKTYGGGENNGKRIAEQGEYFGSLSQDQTTTVGQAGKELVKKLLSKNDFSVTTKWENVYGPDRKYCFVVVPWEGKQVYLHELLVAKGLARVHTRGADLPKGRGYHDQKSHLKAIEREAREKKIGAWGL